MDLLAMSLVVLIGGAIHLRKTTGLFGSDTPIMQADGSLEYKHTSDIPIGSNLYLKNDPEAFTLILKEMGLKK